jgi:hypothetical protein
VADIATEAFSSQYSLILFLGEPASKAGRACGVRPCSFAEIAVALRAEEREYPGFPA